MLEGSTWWGAQTPKILSLFFFSSSLLREMYWVTSDFFQKPFLSHSCREKQNPTWCSLLYLVMSCTTYNCVSLYWRRQMRIMFKTSHKTQGHSVNKKLSVRNQQKLRILPTKSCAVGPPTPLFSWKQGSNAKLYTLHDVLRNYPCWDTNSHSTVPGVDLGLRTRSL